MLDNRARARARDDPAPTASAPHPRCHAARRRPVRAGADNRPDRRVALIQAKIASSPIAGAKHRAHGAARRPAHDDRIDTARLLPPAPGAAPDKVQPHGQCGPAGAARDWTAAFAVPRAFTSMKQTIPAGDRATSRFRLMCVFTRRPKNAIAFRHQQQRRRAFRRGARASRPALRVAVVFMIPRSLSASARS